MQYEKSKLLAIPFFCMLATSVQAETINKKDENTRFLKSEKNTPLIEDNKNTLSGTQLIQPKAIFQQPKPVFQQPKAILQKTKPILQQNQPVVNTIKANNSIPTHVVTEKTWDIIRGKDLRAQLDGWSTAAGWSLVWDSEYSYSIQANASFKGDYISVVKQLFSALGEDVNPKLYPELYQGNRVLKVTNQAR